MCSTIILIRALQFLETHSYQGGEFPGKYEAGSVVNLPESMKLVVYEYSGKYEARCCEFTVKYGAGSVMNLPDGVKQAV